MLSQSVTKRSCATHIESYLFGFLVVFISSFILFLVPVLFQESRFIRALIHIHIKKKASVLFQIGPIQSYSPYVVYLSGLFPTGKILFLYSCVYERTKSDRRKTDREM